MYNRKSHVVKFRVTEDLKKKVASIVKKENTNITDYFTKIIENYKLKK